MVKKYKLRIAECYPHPNKRLPLIKRVFKWSGSLSEDRGQDGAADLFTYEGCDVFLMATPQKNGKYKESDNRHLYLYTDSNGDIFYRLKEVKKEVKEFQYVVKANGEHSSEDNALLQLLSKDKFFQPEIGPNKYDNREVCDQVLAITSAKGHTQSASEDAEYLIKQEIKNGRPKPEVCVLEAACSFVLDYIPNVRHPDLKSSVHFAVASRWIEPDAYDDKDPVVKIKKGKEIAITVQRKLQDHQPWVKVMTGKKRKARELTSFESRNAEEIKNSISQMTLNAKYQLATAIYASEMVGDESLHTGQFMVTRDPETGQINSITRIDFGAAGRFAEGRMNSKDNHLGQASSYYQSSGQYGKNYISYLLADRDINARYLELWASNTHAPEDIAKRHREEVVKQLNNIPVTERQNALEGIYNTLTAQPSALAKTVRMPKQKIRARQTADWTELATPEEDVLNLLETTTKARIEQMQAESIAKLFTELTDLFHQIPSSSFKPLMLGTDPNTGKPYIDFTNFLAPENFALLIGALKLQLANRNLLQPMQLILYHLEAHLKFNLRLETHEVSLIRQHQLAVIHDMRNNLEIREDCIKKLDVYKKSLSRFWSRNKIQVIEGKIKELKLGASVDSELFTRTFLLDLNNGGKKSKKLSQDLQDLKLKYIGKPAQPKQNGVMSNLNEDYTVDSSMRNRARSG